VGCGGGGWFVLVGGGFGGVFGVFAGPASGPFRGV
jgi:hypothetical protein